MFSGLKNTINTKQCTSAQVFIASWLLVFGLYLPAAQAGFVADYTGWLDQTLRYGFWDNLNRTHYHGTSLYQFTQLVTWLYFQLAGTHAWAWYLFFITLHALNAALLFAIFTPLLVDAGIKNARSTVLCGILFFNISPALSEVIVWESSYHFLQGLLLMLGVIRLSQLYYYTHNRNYAWLAGLVFLLATFSLEVFYLTPWLVLALAVYYKSNNKTAAKEIITFIFLPCLLLFLGHLILFHQVYGSWVAHIGEKPFQEKDALAFNKPWKHLFHLLLLGRFWDTSWKENVYDVLDIRWVSTALSIGVAVVFILLTVPFAKKSQIGRVIALLLVFVAGHLCLLQPLWFQSSFIVVYDRYTYCASAFVFMLVAVLGCQLRLRYVTGIIAFCFLLLNLRFTILVSRMWMKSERVITGLLATFPAESKKTVVLLNLPQTLQGVPMIGAGKESEFKLMHDQLRLGSLSPQKVYDGVAYNMITPTDGAHVKVIDDSTLTVTLNQWGTWWWYEMRGANSYENADYRLDMVDVGHWYKLVLKHPNNEYLLLFQVGNAWKTVDMSKKDVDQY